MLDSTDFSLYCQTPIDHARQDGLHVAVITDGNGRSGRDGHAKGAHNVVRCAEHCRDRGDVAMFCALLLSPENVRKRGEAFFTKMHALFIRLITDMRRGRALARVRCELYGRLDRLARRGGAARRLAHAIELFLEVGDVAEPRMRFVIGVDYDEDVVSALHVDLVVRTGMESPNVIRLSGLRSHPSAAYVATMKLWCELTTGDLDDAITAAERCLPRPFIAGYDAGFVAGFVEELLCEQITAPLRLVLPIAAPESAILAELDRLQKGPLGAQERLAVEYASRRSRRMSRFGPRGKTSQTILLLPPGQRRNVESEGRFAAVLAPGQPSSVWTLADMPFGYASGHGCAPTPRGLVDGLRRALRFQSEHPPLVGGERSVRVQEKGASLAAWPPHIEDLVAILSEEPRSSAEDLARKLAAGDRGSYVQRVADVFAAQELRWAMSRGLLSGEAHWKRAALNYCYTGFAIPFRVPEPTNPTGVDWQPLARHVTRFMLAVAASDEEITDRVHPGETQRERYDRLAAAGRFVLGALRGERVRPPLPAHGADVLGALATHFEGMRERFATAAHPLLFEGFCKAVQGLYRANLNEISPDVADNPLVRSLASSRSRPCASAAIERRYVAVAPSCIGDRIRALLATMAGEHAASHDEASRKIRLLCYLVDVAPGIGAGATFRAAALWAPAESVTEAMAIALDRVATLADCRFRLANDLADLAGSADRDRDAKENAWTVLVPKHLRGKAHELALVRSAVACEEVASWLDEELLRALGDLAACWPSMAAMVRRGIHVGRRFYSMGHYAELSRTEVGTILDEIDSLTPPTPARASGLRVLPAMREVAARAA